MAEIAGLALGAAGLATVFSGCIDAFDHVRVARTQDAALRILSTKLENQKVRFIIWGQSLGLDSADGYDPQLDLPIRRDSIRRTMTLVYELFMEGDCLQQRYGLRKEPEQMPSAVVVFDPAVDHSVWKDFFKKIRVKIKKQRQQQKQQTPPQQQTQLKPVESQGSVVRWVIVDRNEFTSLVTNLRELIDDLESMCKFADVNEYRRMRVTYEIESMGDTESLHLIRAASEDDDDDAMSIAANNRLDELAYTSEMEGAIWSSHKKPPEQDALRVTHSIFSKPEEEALRFYTPPGSVLQAPLQSHSRDRSKSPQDSVGEEIYWVPQASASPHNIYYQNTKYGMGSETLQSDAPTHPIIQLPHRSSSRDESMQRQSPPLGIMFSGVGYDSNKYLVSLPETSSGPRITPSENDKNGDLGHVETLTEEFSTMNHSDDAPPVFDQASVGGLPSVKKMLKGTRIDSSMASTAATPPGHSRNSPFGGDSSDRIEAFFDRIDAAERSSRKVTARARKGHSRDSPSGGDSSDRIEAFLDRIDAAERPSRKVTARARKGAPIPVEPESYQQIIEHVRERRSHRQQPRGRFASILESDGEDDAPVDQVLMPSHIDKLVDVDPHAGQSVGEKPLEEITSTGKDNAE